MLLMLILIFWSRHDVDLPITYYSAKMRNMRKKKPDTRHITILDTPHHEARKGLIFKKSFFLVTQHLFM